MKEHNCKKEYINASLFTGIVLVLMIIGGCSLAEWRDIANDAKTRVPNEAVGLFVNEGENGSAAFTVPDQGDLINSAVGLITGLAAGWYGRKFKEKRYAKPGANVG